MGYTYTHTHRHTQTHTDTHRHRHTQITPLKADVSQKQAPLSMGFFRQEYWSQCPSSPPGDLPDPEIEPESPASPTFQAGS